MGQNLSKKFLQRHVKEAGKTEMFLRRLFRDESLRLSVLTGNMMNAPLEAFSDVTALVKYLLIYDPSKVKREDDDDVDEDKSGALHEDDCTWREVPAVSPGDHSDLPSQELKKVVLEYKSFQELRRLCLEYERVLDISSLSSDGTWKDKHGHSPVSSQQQNEICNNDKSDTTYDPHECSICMDAGIDILLPCLHGYCSICWEDWKSHSNTCPQCRGEISPSGKENVGNDDFWQFENWNEKDMELQLKQLALKIRGRILEIKVNLSPEIMNSHRVIPCQSQCECK